MRLVEYNSTHLSTKTRKKQQSLVTKRERLLLKTGIIRNENKILPPNKAIVYIRSRFFQIDKNGATLTQM